MKSKDSGRHKAFHRADELQHGDTCTGREPIWSDEEEAAFQALGKATRAREHLGELLRLESLIREGARVPEGKADERRSQAHRALTEAASFLEEVDRGEGQ